MGTSTRTPAIRYSSNIGINNIKTKEIRDNYIKILNSKNAERMVSFSLKYVLPPILKSNPKTIPLYLILKYYPYFYNQIQQHELNQAAFNTGEYILKQEFVNASISMPADIISENIADIIWYPIDHRLPDNSNRFISNICKKALEKTITEIMVEGVKAYDPR